jgi:D-amino-acid dehydrogenase
MRVDAVVLGAGVIGVSVACHLQAKGRNTVLIDRRGPAEETSYGNAGLIQREGVYPYGFPHDFGALLRYAWNNTIDAHYHPRAVFHLAPFLWEYWWQSRPKRHAAIARQYATLIEHCVSEHDALAEAAGATDLIRRTGWLKVFRTAAERDARLAEAELWKREYGLNHKALDANQLADKEPSLSPILIGGLHWTDPTAVKDPGGLVNAYAAHFEKLGGRFMKADARTLSRNGEGWSVKSWSGEMIMARDAVVALGPWAGEVTRPLGYRLPLAVKRGYHMHYAPRDGAVLNHPVLDTERGYFLAPMAQGIRLTTGAEFALRDAMKTPVQLGRAEPIARDLFPLGERLDAEPWLGSRPCTPDMMPIIGAAPRHRGLWLACGHAHHGLTLGPVTGRLIAEMVTGEKPFVNPEPFRAERFG